MPVMRNGLLYLLAREFISVLEIEVKTRCDDLEFVEKRLKEKGARLVKADRQVDLYLSHPMRDFASTDEALRIRRAGERTSVTYKGPKVDRDTKTREEAKVEVSSADDLELIFRRLGFGVGGRVEKERTAYSVGGVLVCLDKVEGLGDFVEMEYEGDDLEEGKKVIFSLMNELGLKGSERRSYLELLEKGKRPGR